MKARYYLGLLLLFIAARTSAQQQIPNGSFESWTAGDPDGWVTTNFVGVATPITQSTMAADGQSSLRGEVLSLFGQALPPMAGTGRMTTQQDAILGFPFTGRPPALNGYIATNLLGTDTATVVVAFQRDGDSIGVGFFRTGNDIANLTAFSAPIYWLDSRTPDTAYVLMIIDGEPTPTIGSTFNVDGLRFGPGASVASDKDADAFTVKNLSVGYEFGINNATLSSTKLEIVDLFGRTVATLLDGPTQQTSLRWYGDGLANGMYMARLTSHEGVQCKKLMIAR